MASVQEICSTDPSSQIIEQSQVEEQSQTAKLSQSGNNRSDQGKNVTVLLPSDVTFGAVMPNTIVEQSQVEEQSQIPEPSLSGNNGSGQSKSVTNFLLPSDVTSGAADKLKVFMPNTIEMAQIKKRKEQFKKGINISPEMSEQDVKKTLQDEFEILRNRR